MGVLKHRIYIFLSIFLGGLIAFVLQALLELWYLQLLARDFEAYSFGLTWSTLFFVYRGISFIVFIAGVWAGFRLGEYWWELVYVQRRHWLFRRRTQ
ncbi:MAG: hypothetical protein AAB372_00415 [Patescibacteria group bacterium]